MSHHEFNNLAGLRKAGFKRLRDATALLGEQKGDWRKQKGFHARGAMYLAGYAIECKLKAIAMEVNRCRNLGELQAKWNASEHNVYTHGLEALARRLPMYARFRRSEVWREFAGQVNRWRPSWRYDSADSSNESAAMFLEAVRMVYNWLENNR